MTNLPVKGSDERVQATVHEWGIQVENTNGYVIERIPFKAGFSHEGLANTIARLITESRDCGFKQGQAHVRTALGL